jgi:hypothetical protein
VEYFLVLKTVISSYILPQEAFFCNTFFKIAQPRFKYIWVQSGAFYMLLLLGYRSFMANRRLKINDEKKDGSC